MENAFYFVQIAISVLKNSHFSPDFGHVGKRLDKRVKFNFRIYDVTANNYNTHIAEHIKK